MTTKRKQTKWDPKVVIEAYELARAGMNDQQISKALGFGENAILNWRRKHELLDFALKKARDLRKKAAGQTKDFLTHVYERLPPKLKTFWEEIHRWQNDPSGYQRVEAMLSRAGKRVRQSLFIHALVASNFNASEACRLVNIGREVVEKWKRTDPDFVSLLDELAWHKGNFYESALINKVAEGDIHAILFANRTFNRDRGYSDKSTVEVQGKVEHQHTHLHGYITIDELDLPLEVRKQILEALKRKRAEQQGMDTIDALPDRTV